MHEDVEDGHVVNVIIVYVAINIHETKSGADQSEVERIRRSVRH